MNNSKNIKQPYTTLALLRRYLTLTDDETTMNDELQQVIKDVTDGIDKYTKRFFYPRQQALIANVKESNPSIVANKFDILELYAIADNYGQTQIDLDDIWLSAGDDANLFPKSYIEVSPLSTKGQFEYGVTTKRAVTMDALVGYAEDYGFSDGFLVLGYGGIETESSPDVWVSDILETSTVLRFSGAQPAVSTIIRVENEMMFVDSVTDGVYTVIRGINGSTAIPFSGVDILYEVWEICPDLSHWATRLSAWAYMQEQSPYNTIIMSPQFGSIEMPGDWPVDVLSGLKRYKVRSLENI